MKIKHKYMGHPHPERQFCYWCNPKTGWPGMAADAVISESWVWDRLKEKANDTCSVCGGDLLFDVEQDELEVASSPCTCDVVKEE